MGLKRCLIGNSLRRNEDLSLSGRLLALQVRSDDLTPYELMPLDTAVFVVY